MDLNDISELENCLSKWSDAIADALKSLDFDYNNLFDDYLEGIARSVSSINEAYSSSMADTLSQTLKNYSLPQISIDYSGISSALKQFSEYQLDAISLSHSSLSQTLLDSLSDTVTQIEPYLPPEKKAECENVILPKLKHKSPKLTLSDALSILSLLVAIFFGIIASMPDEQTEQIIAQNEIIIDQQEEIIRLQKEDDALLNALDSLTNSINLLSDEIELLREESESTDDSYTVQSQADPTDSQHQNSSTQD